MIPQYIGKNAQIIESMVTENCRIDGKLWYTVLFSGVQVASGASLNSCVVMSNTKIGRNADIKYAIIADDVVIEDGAVIGDLPENCEDSSKWGNCRYRQGRDSKIRSGCAAERNDRAVQRKIGGNGIMNLFAGIIFPILTVQRQICLPKTGLLRQFRSADASAPWILFCLRL